MDSKKQRPIFIVEDEPKIASVLADYLTAAEFLTVSIDNGLDVLPALRKQEPLLILLDLSLPGCDGLDICREVRKVSATPILIISARVEELDRLLGLELGADDYICKPFSPREIVARVKAVLRRPPLSLPKEERSRQIGPFLLDEERMQIRYHNQKLDLTTSEYRILRKLLLYPGRVYSRSQLLQEIHGVDDDAFERAIDTHIKNIRKKINRIAPSENPLRSVYGVGYQLDTP